MDKMKYINFQICFFVIFVCLFAGGCASMQEAGKKIWGTSIEHLEKVRPQGKSETFALSMDDCFARAEEVLKYAGAEVYLSMKDKGYLTAMNFKGSVNTTQVGIFFTDTGDGRTKVEIASMSPRLVREVAEMVFEGLNNLKAGKSGEEK